MTHRLGPVEKKVKFQTRDRSVVSDHLENKYRFFRETSFCTRFRRWPLHGLLKRLRIVGKLAFPQTIITKGRFYHSKSFHCGLAEFHTKLDTKLVSLLLLFVWSETTELPYVRKLTYAWTQPNDLTMLRCIVTSQSNYWHYFSNEL